MKKLLFILFCSPIISFSQQSQFIDNFSSTGLPQGGQIFGLIDYNIDGFDDIIYRTSVIELYRNNGNGTFTVESNFNIMMTPFAWGEYYEGWFKIIDVDNNDLPDIVYQIGDTLTFYLNMTGDGTFENYNSCLSIPTPFIPLIEYAGFGEGTSSAPIFPSDYDIDGDVDFLFSRVDSNGNNSIWALENNLSINYSFNTPILLIDSIASNKTIPIIAFDYDNDGDEDILCMFKSGTAWVQQQLGLYRNDGSGIYTDVTSISNIGTSSLFGFANVADLNNDGYFDFIIGSTDAGNRNKLFYNNGDGTFTVSASQLDIDVGYGNYHAASQVADFDNDGDVDVIWKSSGFSLTGVPLFVNDGAGNFSEQGAAYNLSFLPIINPGNQNSSGQMLWMDYDNDGKLDHFRADGNNSPTTFLKNHISNSNNYLRIKLMGCSANRNGIGSRVKVIAGGNVSWQANFGANTQAAKMGNSSYLHFGLGTATQADTIVVYWPGGDSTMVTNISPNQLYTLAQNLGCCPTIHLCLPIFGCTDPLATNHDPSATVDDTSCCYVDVIQNDTAICLGDSLYLSVNNSLCTSNPTTPFPGVSRIASATVMIGNIGYFGTGWNGSTVFYNDFWKYDYLSDSWTQLASYPGGATHDPVMFNVQGEIYLGLGGVPGAPSSQFWKYNISSDTWSQKASIPTQTFYNSAYFSIDNKAYVVCGYGINTGILDDVWEYNATLDIWTQLADFPNGALRAPYGESYAGFGYVFGGESANGSNSNKIWKFDPTTNNWTQMQDKNIVERGGLIVESISDGVIFAHGSDGSSTWYSDIWEYLPDTDSWVELCGDSTTNLYSPISFVFNDNLYLSDGVVDQFGSWTFDTTASIRSVRSENVLWSTGDTITSITVSPGQTTTYWVIQNGCTDSVIVTVLPTTSDTSYITACDSVVWNGALLVTSGTYSWLGMNSNGCDSTVILNLTINHIDTSYTNITACDSVLWNDTTYSSGGAYTYSTINSNGCDSIAILDLTINNSYSAPTINIQACRFYVWAGAIYDSSGIYYQTTSLSNGCDSSGTLDLTIHPSPTGQITQAGNILNAVPTGGTAPYTCQWNSNESTFAIIPFVTGVYWCVVVDANGCETDTLFINVTNISTSIVDMINSKLKVYPNPTDADVTIEFTSLINKDIGIKIVNVLGGRIFEERLYNFKGDFSEKIRLTDYTKGIYFLQIETAEGVIIKKLILQ